MTQLIDRRSNGGKKNTVNRQRFLSRYKTQIKKSVADAINQRSITDIARGEKINIPHKDIAEPHFDFGKGGVVERTFSGNDQFITGDHLKRPENPNKDGGGSEASNDSGEGEDPFIFELSREEFLEIYFEDLELPFLIKKELAQINRYKRIRAGVTKVGNPSNINVVRSMCQAYARRIALKGPHKHALNDALATLESLANTKTNQKKREQLVIEIERLQKKINRIPFIDTIDLRYNHIIKIPAPSTQAVMFCVMDVSGSMDEAKKEIAKRFFILLYLFLTRHYEKIELVFIRHHTSAKEVNEQDFFYSRETGGTVVSSALDLVQDIIQKRFNPSSWNIYVAQASDGDNWNADSPRCFDILKEQILPQVQYYAYVEIMPRHHQSLWTAYEKLKTLFPQFAMENIEAPKDIYPVFRELFKRQPA